MLPTSCWTSIISGDASLSVSSGIEHCAPFPYLIVATGYSNLCDLLDISCLYFCSTFLMYETDYLLPDPLQEDIAHPFILPTDMKMWVYSSSTVPIPQS